MKIKSKIYAVYQCGDRWLYHSRDDAQRECDRLNDETDGEIGDGAATVMEIDVSDDD